MYLEFSNYLKDHPDALSVGGAIVGAISTVGASIAAAAAKNIAVKFSEDVSEKPESEEKSDGVVAIRNGTALDKSTQLEKISPIVEVNPPTPTALALRATEAVRDQINEKLDRIKLSKFSQERRGLRARIASNSLIFGQYILGGIITASSFITHHVDPTALGIMGVVVIASTATRKHYHPEIDAEDADHKAARYGEMIVDTKDDLFELEQDLLEGEDRSKELRALNREVSKRIKEIENPYAPRTRAKTTIKKYVQKALPPG